MKSHNLYCKNLSLGFLFGDLRQDLADHGLFVICFFLEQTFPDEVIVMERAVRTLDLTHNKICMSFFHQKVLSFLLYF